MLIVIPYQGFSSFFNVFSSFDNSYAATINPVSEEAIDNLVLKSRGAPKKFSPEKVAQIRERVETETIQFNSPTDDRLGAIIKELVPDTTCSTVTYRKLLKECNLVRTSAAIKTTPRVEAYRNIRNAISLCCLANYCQSVVSRATYHSIDDVSIIINEFGDKPKVTSTTNILLT